MNSSFHALTLSRNETAYGTRYLGFQLVFLSPLLTFCNRLLPVALSGAQINFAYFFINFLAVCFIFRRYLAEMVKQLRNTLPRVLAVSVAGLALYWVATFLLDRLTRALCPDFFSLNDRSIQALFSESFFLMLLGTVIFAPITEEVLYRGLLFRGLYDRNAKAALCISVLFFAGVHILSYVGSAPLGQLLLCFIQYLPAGFLFAGCYYYSGSLLSPILIHMAVNFSAMLALR